LSLCPAFASEEKIKELIEGKIPLPGLLCYFVRLVSERFCNNQRWSAFFHLTFAATDAGETREKSEFRWCDYFQYS
jgi:hypothetical protein